MSKIPDYTLVCGVDARHLKQLAVTWPTWKKHKPGLLDVPMIVFRDKDEVEDEHVREVVDHPNLAVYAWPMGDAVYSGHGESKWTNPQRHKMLAGFVYIPGLFVNTPYWLKLDTDVVATGQDDWIDPKWFRYSPVIISHRWGYTKPANQMVVLDAWVNNNIVRLPALAGTTPLDLVPEPGSNRVSHKRIISWCAFFDTAFTSLVTDIVTAVCGRFQLPVASQDGVMWYLAKRIGSGIHRCNMKQRGWEHWSTERNIMEAAGRAMDND